MESSLSSFCRRSWRLWSLQLQTVCAAALVLVACADGLVAADDVAQSRRPSAPANRRLGGQLAFSFDAGDSYVTPSGPRKLRRLAGALAIREGPTGGKPRLQAAASVPPLAGYVAEAAGTGAIKVYSASREEKLRQLRDDAAFGRALAGARRTKTGKSANPVFVDPQTGLRLLATEDIVLRLKPGVDATVYFGAAWKNVQPLWGTTDQFTLKLPGATAEKVLAETTRRARHPQVEWAEPDFISEVVKCALPNDPYVVSRQWHLNNTGQGGGTPGADARLSEAWDTTTGNPNIVIAIVDDGVQVSHPDLAANIFQNPGEIPGNGLDDDLNGFRDDVRGWDFIRSDADAGPDDPDDNHGTAIAGVAAAVGDNSLGVAGVAYHCRLLPIKVISGDFSVAASSMARALRYAAGLSATGSPVWRGADIINISLIFSPGLIAQSAFQDVVTKGRGGKGCPIFVAAGNSASAWQPFDLFVTNAGTYTLRWEYSKDANDVLSIGDDTVWLDSITWPGGTHETFESGLPAGWTTSAGASWTGVTDGVNGNRAMLGWNGPGSRSLRAGRISDNQTTYVETTKFLEAGPMRFWVWVSSEITYDIFRFKLNGVERFSESGVPILATQVGYPANLPQAIAVGASTDFDYRSDYSQYGSKLDIVAPSDGGAAGIYTVDRAGVSGYNDGTNQDGDYTPGFGGTSSATPLASGIAALVLSVNPHLTASDVRALLRDSSDKIGSVTYDAAGRNNFYGSGRINAARALQMTKADLNVSVAASANPVTQGDTTTYTISVVNRGPARSGDLVVSSQLPANVNFGSAVPAPASRMGNLLTFTSSALANGSAALFTITVTNLLPGTNVMLVAANSDVAETNLADNSTSLSTTVLPAPVIFVSDAQTIEGTVGSGGRLSFNVTLDRPSSRTVTVTYTTVTNTAGRTDFKSMAGTLTFLPNQTGAQIAVDATPDALDEADEIFVLKLSKPVNAVLGNTQAAGMILDDDEPPAVLMSGLTVREGNAGARPALFLVRLSAPSGRTVTVDFRTQAGTAEAGSDFIPTNGVLTFPPGNTLQRFSVAVLGDSAYEGAEFFEIQLGNPTNAVLSQLQQTCTILDNELAPRMFVSDATVTEADSDTTNAVFAIRLSAPAAVPVSVSFATTNGSATGDVDFMATNGVLDFAPGETNLLLAIPVLGDLLSESNEFFSVRLFSPTNATLGDSLARGTILDNDPLPGLSLSDAVVTENGAGPTNATFVVALSAASGRKVTVRFATAGGTAGAGADFVPKSGVLTFPPGTLNQNIVVSVNRDSLVEPDEMFFVNLSLPVNATLADAQAAGTILARPAMATDVPMIAEARIIGGRFSLRFATIAGVRYGVECSESLTMSANWTPLSGAENIAGTGGVIEVFDEQAAAKAKCFYRVRTLP